jgi:glycosyltransferase involved in cell wall biosynthesis
VSAAELSVVVPTHDRAEALARCLDALAAQRVDVPFEVVVADDGSTDATASVLDARGDVQAVRIAHAGRSAARNAALRRACGRLVLFVDDDVIATDGLLQRHVEHHRAHPEEGAALVGLVTWHPELEVTPHMRWLERGGPLFAFDTIADPGDVDWRHFCTANVSVKRSFLGEDPFDEELERSVDVELAYRLSRRGMRLRYDADAVARHLRVDTPESTARRMRSVGRAVRLMHAKHPEIAEPPPSFGRLTPLKVAAARAVAPVARRTGVIALDERLFSHDAARAYAAGYAVPPGTAISDQI